MDRPIYSLHLFAGAGGGLLADLICGVRPVCAVEIEKYPQRVLARRFPGLPIWDDVCTFRADNPDCADAFRWLREHRADLCVAGGFPCQDISSAGLQRGIDGARSGLWREFARILGEVRPRFAFVENSPNLVRLGLGRILGDLAALGYDARWNVLPASAVGARHERERIWIAAALRDAVRVWGGGKSEVKPSAAQARPRPLNCYGQEPSRPRTRGTGGGGLSSRTVWDNGTSTTSPCADSRLRAPTTPSPQGGANLK